MFFLFVCFFSIMILKGFFDKTLPESLHSIVAQQEKAQLSIIKFDVVILHMCSALIMKLEQLLLVYKQTWELKWLIKKVHSWIIIIDFNRHKTRHFP